MPNYLFRSGRVEEIPEVFPRAYQPAYSYFVEERLETIQTGSVGQVVYVPGLSAIAPVWVNDGEGRAILVYPGRPATPGYSYVTYTPYQTSNVTTRVVRIDVPEQPAVAGSPAQRIEYPPVGWTSFARSIANAYGSASITLRVKEKAVGVAFGFKDASTPNPEAGYSHLRDGLLFTGGTVAWLRNGAALGGYVETDTFVLTRRLGGAVSVTKNGTLLDTVTSQEKSVFPAQNKSLLTTNELGVAMYATGDMVYDPVLTAIADGIAEMTLPQLAMNGGAGAAKSSAIMSLPAFVLTAGESYGAHMQLPAMMMSASQYAYAQAVGSLPALTMLAYGGSLTVVKNAGADMSMPWMLMSGLMLNGGTGEAAMTTEALTLMAADRTYGEARMTLPGMWMTAYYESPNEANAFELLGAGMAFTGSVEILALVFDGAVVNTTAVPTGLLDAIAQTRGTVEGTALTNQLLEALAYSFANAGQTAIVPGVGVDTWVWNADSKGSTSYSGYDFNSFARIGDRYYGASEDGLFELDGETDAGAPIRAVISPGKLGFGTSVKKTVVDCYVGMSGEGYLTLKVIAEGQSYLYRTRSFSEEMQQQKIDLGLGLRTNYVTLELFNENGEDFEVDTLEFLVADLSRRIGG